MAVVVLPFVFMAKEKKLLFSVTAKDCEWQAMTAGGHGGQHMQHNNTAVRCTHRPSGATAVGREYRSQIQNKRAAFKRMAESEKFQRWAKIEASKRQGHKTVEEIVDELMAPENIRIEYFD